MPERHDGSKREPIHANTMIAERPHRHGTETVHHPTEDYHNE